ncbi:uncharacterized protein LOC113050724 [Carassius auratus]|uniref:Uncharacterized protein LOC113050724 n=1 Tax=Carassius auratus TaxID=7957 RepID=A0A6P6KF64_CARAU|nr:uncharacterized protein LOC113050724 [Carassius auratus]
MAGSGEGNWRGESRETEVLSPPAPPRPAPLGGALVYAKRPWSVPLRPWGGTRGGPGGRDLGRGTGREREGGEREGERELVGGGVPTPGHATMWSSARWMADSSGAGRWHWNHSAVFLGSRVMNCSSTTRSMTRSTSLPSASSHLRQESRSCWANAKGRPASPKSRERKRWRMALFRSSKTRRFATGSCCAATWASPESRGIRRTGHCSRGHPQASAAFSKSSRKASGSSWAPILCSGRCMAGGLSTNLPIEPAPEPLAVLLLGLDDGLEPSLLVGPQIQQRLVLLAVEDREGRNDVRKRRRSVFLPGFRHQCC